MTTSTTTRTVLQCATGVAAITVLLLTTGCGAEQAPPRSSISSPLASAEADVADTQPVPSTPIYSYMGRPGGGPDQAS